MVAPSMGTCTMRVASHYRSLFEVLNGRCDTTTGSGLKYDVEVPLFGPPELDPWMGMGMDMDMGVIHKVRLFRKLRHSSMLTVMMVVPGNKSTARGRRTPRLRPSPTIITTTVL